MGSSRFWPTICRLYPTPMERTPAKHRGSQQSTMACICTASRFSRIPGTDRTQTTSDCTQFSCTPSKSWARRSIRRICTAKPSAPPTSITSPILMPPALVKLSRYSPTSARSTLNTALSPGFRCTKMPSTGTSTIYMAVRNPALPGAVYTSPTCCKLAAANSATPQVIPPRHSFGFLHFCSAAASPALRSSSRDTRNRKITPNRHRMA